MHFLITVLEKLIICGRIFYIYYFFYFPESFLDRFHCVELEQNHDSRCPHICLQYIRLGNDLGHPDKRKILMKHKLQKINLGVRGDTYKE